MVLPTIMLLPAAAPGNSGSPVMSTKGEVVSVLQMGWSRSFTPVTGGATYTNLKWVQPLLHGAHDINAISHDCC